MKTLFAFALAGLFMVACAPKATQTIEDLKAAATGETNASNDYSVYSQKAEQEGYTNIARMFAATSAAEKRHAAKHLEELAKLGVTDYVPEVNQEFNGTTVENLQKAIEGETYEYTQMYPGFMANAEKEKVKGALIAFEWAKIAEEKHAGFYKEALEYLTDSLKGDQMFAYTWYVCPKCGDTYRNDQVPSDACQLCGTAVSEFMKF